MSSKKKTVKKEDSLNLKLMAAAKDMNRVMGLNPKIDTSLAVDELIEEIKENAKEIEEGDEFKSSTEKVLAELDKEEVDETEDEKDDDDDDDDEEKEEEDTTTTSKKKAVKSKVKVSTKKAKTEKKKVVKGEKQITKKSIVIDMVSRKKGASLSEMAERMVELGVDSAVEQNMRTAKLWIPKIGFKVSQVGDKYVKA